MLPSACRNAPGAVLIQLKYTPGLTITHRQILKGSVRAFWNDSLMYNVYREGVSDIENRTIRINADSIAESEVSITHDFTRRPAGGPPDSSKTKTEKYRIQYVEYLKPNGRLVDLAFTGDKPKSDTAWVRQYFQQAFPVFPEQPVQPGYSWTQTTEVRLPDGPSEASTTFAVKSFARERGYDCVIIVYDGTCVVPIRPQSPGEMGQFVDGVDRISISGHLYFAFEEGFVVAQREHWRMLGDYTEVDPHGDTVRYRTDIESDLEISLLSVDTVADTTTTVP